MLTLLVIELSLNVLVVDDSIADPNLIEKLHKKSSKIPRNKRNNAMQTIKSKVDIDNHRL